MKAFKVFETQQFERGIDPKDSMKLGDVLGRLLKIRRAEAIQAMEEILNTHGGDGPFFFDKDDDETGFKIAIYQDTPIQSRFSLGGNEVRYFIEFNVTTESFFVGWEQEDKDGKWKERQWTSKISAFGGDIKTTDQAKQTLIDYIQSNKPLKGTLNEPE